MKFKHPVEIPRSKAIVNFEWTGERVPCARLGIKGDSHPLTWADDDCIYVGTGDPNWFEDGNGNAVTISWTQDQLNDEMTVRRGCGLAVEKFTGSPECFGLERINDMTDFVGGGGGPKPTGMICVDLCGICRPMGQRQRNAARAGAQVQSIGCKRMGIRRHGRIRQCIMANRAERIQAGSDH